VDNVRSAFTLSKWYADCVTPAGDALILYSAQLGWRAAAIPYTSLLIHPAHGPTRMHYSLRRQTPPGDLDGAIRWKDTAWQTDAAWSDRGTPLFETLLDLPEGRLEWSCIAPRCSARFRIGGGEFHGWGYVEQLRLTIPPWRMPLQCLRWGRFVNATDSLVWIDWTGPSERRVVYCNGTPVRALRIDDHRIVLPGDAVLSLENPTVLREGRLGSTALSVLPNLQHLFPARLLDMRECKWLSRAVLRRPGLPDSHGMAIHEVVEWP
jgi:hypothetical protein